MMAENEQNGPENYYVNQHEPEAKPPPALETGILKWVRENLFNSIFNTILTFVGLFVIYLTITGLFSWIVSEANWFHVSFNLRNYMLGTYEREFEWRANLTLYISVFAIGAAVAVWVRQISRTMLISVVVIILSLQIVPRLIDSSMELPSWYAGAGNMEIQVAQTIEVAFDEIAFIGEEGDEIRITFASEDTGDEEALANMNGFVDNIANTLRNQANNRLTDIAELEEIQALVEEQQGLQEGDVPLITVAQYDAYVAEIEAAEDLAPIIETYNINQISVLVEIIDPETMEALASTTLTSPDDAFEVTLPASGWYILHKVLVPDDDVTEGFALLDVQGILPASKLESTQSLIFTRRPDGFRVFDQGEPVVDGEELPFIDIIRNQYRGERPLSHYLRAYVSPFFSDIANYVTLVLLIGVAGYVVTEGLRVSNGVATASSFATYALVSIPLVVWVLINGMFLYSVMMWLLFASLCLMSYLLFQIVKRDGFSPVIAVAGLVIYLVFVAVLIRTGPDIGEAYLINFGDTQLIQLPQGFDFPNLLTLLPLVIDDAAVPRFLVWLGIGIIPFAIYSGKQAYIPGEEVKVNTILVGGSAVVLFLVGAIATLFTFESGSIILPITIQTEWLLQPSDPRVWGGLLLTMVLTIYGIIIAFPIGVALALGRRSDLPLIKWLCTAYIELVRGSPFITVLFFMQLFIPLLNPEFSQVPGSYRAIAATIAFSAAYLAENVRGGLQSLPPGQEEAAKALGLNPWQSITLITLPQALRAVIPALVGQFIGLFKDTSLVTIVGLVDLVGIVNTVVVQAEFIGTRLEGLLFISILYFVVSYVMSYISRLLEASGSGSTRRM